MCLRTLVCHHRRNLPTRRVIDPVLTPVVLNTNDLLLALVTGIRLPSSVRIMFIAVHYSPLVILEPNHTSKAIRYTAGPDWRRRRYVFHRYWRRGDMPPRSKEDIKRGYDGAKHHSSSAASSISP